MNLIPSEDTLRSVMFHILADIGAPWRAVRLYRHVRGDVDVAIRMIDDRVLRIPFDNARMFRAGTRGAIEHLASMTEGAYRDWLQKVDWNRIVQLPDANERTRGMYFPEPADVDRSDLPPDTCHRWRTINALIRRGKNQEAIDMAEDALVELVNMKRAEKCSQSHGKEKSA